jgi:hypothetical protein
MGGAFVGDDGLVSGSVSEQPVRMIALIRNHPEGMKSEHRPIEARLRIQLLTAKAGIDWQDNRFEQSVRVNSLSFGMSGVLQTFRIVESSFPERMSQCQR